MNFHVRPGYSILLMSTRKGAPYHDRWDQANQRLIYEGHDQPRRPGEPDPKTVDQPLSLPSGRRTPNGKFYDAAKSAATGQSPPQIVRVYEKIRTGVWSDKGLFHLADAEVVVRQHRKVVDFFLSPIDDEEPDTSHHAGTELAHTRLIPSDVKVAVWKRDNGRCVKCGSTDNLHFDHDLPFSLGGSSLTPDNVRILCARHNLQKSNRIE